MCLKNQKPSIEVS